MLDQAGAGKCRYPPRVTVRQQGVVGNQAEHQRKHDPCKGKAVFCFSLLYLAASLSNLAKVSRFFRRRVEVRSQKS